MTIERFEKICDRSSPEIREELVLFLALCCNQCRKKFKRVLFKTPARLAIKCLHQEFARDVA